MLAESVTYIHLLTYFQNHEKPIKTSQLEKALQKAKYSYGNATEEVSKAVKDKILNPVQSSSKSKSNGVIVNLVTEKELTCEQDKYCFECFGPGELVKCRDCARAFHTSCARRSPERPNYVLPPQGIISEYLNEEFELESRNGSQNEITIMNSNEKVGSPISESLSISTIIMKPCRVVLHRHSMMSLNSYESEVMDKSDIKSGIQHSEVICLGEVRPPTRQRTITQSNSSLKSESSENLQLESEKELCTCCRMLKVGSLLQPPQMDCDELCHLLKYAYKRCRKWFKNSISKKIERFQLSKKSISLLYKIILPSRPIMTQEIIQQKIYNCEYKLLIEILIDALELQYNIGVLFGKDSLEFDISKYFVKDLTYDIQEIRRCPDCFRHSNDRITKMWFALPCVQRHELVFAKCKGHGFWPAKVLRVVQNGTKYDVRFFGGNHSRGIIDKCYIRPIDTIDFEQPKLVSFKTAMKELQCYQALEMFSSNNFSFNANKSSIDNIVKTVMEGIEGGFTSNDAGSIRSRRRTIQVCEPLILAKNSATDQLPNYSQSTPQNYTRTERNKRGTAMPTLTQNDSFIRDTPSSATSLSSLNDIETVPKEQYIADSNELLKKCAVMEENYELVKSELKILKRKLELHQRELTIAKRKSYCFKCLQPAKFLCCFNACYCSPVCQRLHWYEEHSQHCSNKS